MTEGFKGFYFKSKVILVDDNKSFLDGLSFKLSENHSVDIYCNPFNAIDEIISNYNNSILNKATNFLVELEQEENDENYYAVDYSKITGLAEVSNKNQIISVVIVDYSMPLINGIEFCKKIAHIPVLKIMLTGHADFTFAVDAFNKGIIDRFLVKDTPLMIDEIKHGISLMQKRFFEKYSFPLLNCFSINKQALVTSTEYMTHLQEVMNQFNPIEFYILDVLGSYLIVAEDGTRYYFAVMLDYQLNEYIEIAKDLNADSDLINKMIKKTHAPVFIDEMDYKLPVSKWNLLLQPIQQKVGYNFTIFSEKVRFNQTRSSSIIAPTYV